MMDHYASEMDPDFGKPTYGERQRARHRQSAIDELTAVIAGVAGIREGANLEALHSRIERIVDSIIYAVDTR